MKTYDSSKPLIFIHVPKTAGSAVQQVFKNWFGPALRLNYFNEAEGSMPHRLDLKAQSVTSESPVVYGHFNRLRGFGIEDYYPEVTQFVTILRDPFEMALSNYFFLHRVGSDWQNPPEVIGTPLDHYLGTTKLNMLNHFPREVTWNNYREIFEENFIAVGITERLPESLERIGKKLGREFNKSELTVVNPSKRVEPVTDSMRETFEQNNALECAVYQWALERFEDG